MIAVNLNSRILNPAPDAPADVVTVKPVSVAYLLGASDAEAGAAFAPESYYVRRVDKIAYAFGFEAVRGANEATRQFTKSVNWGQS